MSSYNDALTPVFLWLLPLAIASCILLLFVKEVPLATTLDKDAAPAARDGDGDARSASPEVDHASPSEQVRSRVGSA